jgi:hypothetical protein
MLSFTLHTKQMAIIRLAKHAQKHVAENINYWGNKNDWRDTHNVIWNMD